MLYPLMKQYFIIWSIFLKTGMKLLHILSYIFEETVKQKKTIYEQT